jgi:hypothetical protein
MLGMMPELVKVMRNDESGRKLCTNTKRHWQHLGQQIIQQEDCRKRQLG